MTEGTVERLVRAVSTLHGASAQWIETVQIVDSFEGREVWRGEVEGFALKGHPEATRAYAWEAETDTGRKKVYAVLGKPPIDSAVAAVRASIVADYQSGKP